MQITLIDPWYNFVARMTLSDDSLPQCVIYDGRTFHQYMMTAHAGEPELKYYREELKSER